MQVGPAYLLIQLKRFRAEEKKKVKNNEPVEYPEAMELAGQKYMLLAVIVHEGSMDAGHYWAIRRVDGRWVAFNDEETSELPTFWTTNAYVLLYGPEA